MGIDPGTGRLGWAVVEKNNGSEKLVDCGTIETPVKTPLPDRLAIIFTDLRELIEKYKPDEGAIEELFFERNVTTAMAVARASGVVLLVFQLAKIPTVGYSPVQVKAGLTGYGRADKQMVEKMVMMILKLKEKQKLDDTADAMAVALTHLAARKFKLQ